MPPQFFQRRGARGAPSSRAPIGVHRACAPLGLPRGVAFVLSRVCCGRLSAEAAGLILLKSPAASADEGFYL